MDYFMNFNGWVGVTIGLGLFLMGYWKGGADTARRVIPATVAATIDQMVEDGYVRARKVLNSEGKWEEELLKYDEEV